MEVIRIYVEQIVQLCGVTGTMVSVLRHAVLVIVAVLLAWLCDAVCRKIIVPLINKITHKTDAMWDDILFDKKVMMSACHVVPALVIWQLLPLVFYQYPFAREVLSRITCVYITIMSLRTALAVISSMKHFDSGKRSSTQQYFYTFCGVLRILLVFMASIVVIAILIGKSPWALFAGLGATSAILMLVFKDTIEGVVAGVRLTSNDMMHIGDWITVPKAGANGVVTAISLTTVKVRNFDNTIITISPKTLVDESFQNWKGMQQGGGRRVKRLVYYDFHSVKIMDEETKRNLVESGYITAEEAETNSVNMSLYRKYVERYLRSRADVNGSMTLMVRQLEATNAGLPLEFYFFLTEKEWVEYEHHLADTLEYIYAITPEFGLKIYQQYPTQ